jgi:methyl-accepting chemotaxis protein
MQDQAHQLAALVGTFQTGQPAATRAAQPAATRAVVPAKARSALTVVPVRKEPVVEGEEWETF